MEKGLIKLSLSLISSTSPHLQMWSDVTLSSEAALATTFANVV